MKYHYFYYIHASNKFGAAHQFSNLQPWPCAYKRLLNKYYVNGVSLKEQNLCLKFCHSYKLKVYSKYVIDLLKEVLLFSIDQRAANLLAIKVGGFKRNSATWPTMLSARVTQVWVSNDGINLKVWGTATLQPFHLKRLTVCLKLIVTLLKHTLFWLHKNGRIFNIGLLSRSDPIYIGLGFLEGMVSRAELWLGPNTSF